MRWFHNSNIPPAFQEQLLLPRLHFSILVEIKRDNPKLWGATKYYYEITAILCFQRNLIVLMGDRKESTCIYLMLYSSEKFSSLP